MEVPLRPGGPDHYGKYIDDSVSLGHRRLAVIDPHPEANQPFVFEHLVMSYNGEVYNYKEIRKELGEYEFATDSDTEVVIKAFHKWGLKALDRFVGMFAIALWDKKERKLHLIRDRFGVKPLYYHHRANNFIFASELKGIAAHPRFVKAVDKKAAALFFQLGYIPTPHSIYENTHKLEPGTILTYDGKRVQKRRYYDFAHVLQKPLLSEAEAREGLEPLLEEAFELRMVADVDVGVFLSGGIDSSLVSAILSRRHRLKTFTIGFDDPRFDESQVARQVALRIGSEHYEKRFGLQELLRTLPEMMEVFDEPFGDASALPTLLLSAFTARHVKVTLSADGADELFWGYPINFKWAARYPAMQRLRPIAPFLRRLPQKGLKKRGYLATDDFLAYKLATRYRFYPDETGEAYGLEAPQSEDLLESLFLFDLRYFLIDDVLVKVDRASMAHSLEAREPFLDHRLAEFALRIPPSLKQDKKILRDILAKYLPREVVERPKQGFSVPIKRWLFGELLRDVERVMERESIADEITGPVKFGPRRYNELWYSYLFRLWEERWL
jgi:asparagine synthase (glutamine-hydrolysing)